MPDVMRIETFTTGECVENAYLIRHDTHPEAVAIDPGDDPGPLIECVRANRKTLAAILLTHAHFDHVTGVGELKEEFGVPAYAHEADKDLYDHVVEQAAFFGFHAVPQPPLDRLLNDGDAIEIGPFRFEVLHTPGHTPGGVCYRIGDALFVGDTIFAGGIGRTDVPGASQNQLIQSIRQKILTLDDTVALYPGHGPPTTVGAERRRNPFLL